MMTRADAAAILQIPPTASAEEARRAYQELFTEHQVRLTNAPTPALRNLYQARLRELDEARDAMLALESSDDTDLPLAEPKLPGASGPGWRSEADSARRAASESAAAPPKPRDEAPPPTPRDETPAPKRERETPKPPPARPAAEAAAEKKATKESERDSGLISDPPSNSKRKLIIAAAVIGLGLAGAYLFTRDGKHDGSGSLVASTGSFTAVDSAAALGRVRRLYTRIHHGEKFEDVARRESDDSTTASRGGDLGSGNAARFGADFELVASRLAPGVSVASLPVLTTFGYHLIRLDRKEGDALFLHHILVRIRPVTEETKAYIKQQLREDLAIARTAFGRAEYDTADAALKRAEAFTSSSWHFQPTPAGIAAVEALTRLKTAPPLREAQETLVGAFRSEAEELRKKIDRACASENQIAELRHERKPCTYLSGFQRPW